MKRISTSTGPFPIRLYYPDDEIERICSKALADTGFLPTKLGPIRIDRFIDTKFNVPIIWETLDQGVLGYTEFGPSGVKSVHITPATGDLFVQEDRRINATLAHEAGHILLHTQLFVEHFANQTTFRSHPQVTDTYIMCREEKSIVLSKEKPGYAGEWWEFQANRAIGALLMPKELFLTFMQPFLKRTGISTIAPLPPKVQQEAIKAASDVFDVNEMVARIRIESHPL